MLALVNVDQQALVPVFSAQVILKYDKMSYKGLDIET
jgi:hypothetical protein